MSNFIAKTYNPWTGEVEDATWLDNHFGPHLYGVRFANGDIADPRQDPVKLIKTDQLRWTEKGYNSRQYCYYCKAEASQSNGVNHSGYGCTNCRNYYEATHREVAL